MKYLRVPRGILRACEHPTAENSGLPQGKATRLPRWQICPDSQPAACISQGSPEKQNRERDRCVIRDQLNFRSFESRGLQLES